jgi:hypothetical protein
MRFAAACIYDLYFAFTQFTPGDQSGYKAKIAVIFAGPMLVTNILSTSLIAWKAWYVIWLFVFVLVQSHDKSPPTPGITTKH